MTLIYIAACPKCDWRHQREGRPSDEEQVECACCGRVFAPEWQEEEQEEPLVLKPEDVEPSDRQATATPDEATPSTPPPLPPPIESTRSNQQSQTAVIYRSANRYSVELCNTGFFSGTLDAAKLETQINRKAAAGWRFLRSIHERRRVLGLFSREAHFLIFVRDTD